ncbi:MAG TPA: prolyl oligopeptidase family serine peptidase [Streptosporangiaceae bacterium]|nr:prolyl oligopeptidase family serine peptidase [Streptosporangiaceae bacterium]
MAVTTSTDSFPRQNARTRNFTLGVPRSFQISPDGGTVLFLRSRGGSDPVNCLWALDVASGQERLVADPSVLSSTGLGSAGAAEDPVEKARRERVRERAGGIVAFATDADLAVAAFTLGGLVYLADLRTGQTRELPTATPAADPRPAPDGRHLAYVSDGALRLVAIDGSGDRALADPEGMPGITFGLADFAAAEELGRTRGYWWAPDSSAILVARVDETPVQTWHIADPANPAAPASAVRYPAAGTANAVVSLYLCSLDGKLTRVDFDEQAFPYLVTAAWERAGNASQPPLIAVLSRDQRELRLLTVDPDTGSTTLVRADTDKSWVDVVPGVPARTAAGAIVWAADADGAKRLVAGTAQEHAAGRAMPMTPPSLQVRSVLSVDGDTVLFRASAADPASIALWTAGPDGIRPASEESGVHDGKLEGGTLAVASRSLQGTEVAVRVLRRRADGAFAPAADIASLAEQPSIPLPRVTLGYSAGPSRVRTAIMLPSWYEPGSGKLPVLCDPYGGPHAQRALSALDAYLTSQWFADQGFAVLIADGRGTPGRGPEWDRAVKGDLATPALEDQVEALRSAADQCADLDLSRVAIRGWSFGGYLSALAVLRRPDVFHAAVAGAPVTDWRLYDTVYTERYLGHPDFSPEAYERSSLIADAPTLTRPLMIIHGLADDNVVVAHTLRLSSALLAAGRPHTVLPLSGVTHMAAQEEVAENLLLLQVDFLREALGIKPPAGKAQ